MTLNVSSQARQRVGALDEMKRTERQGCGWIIWVTVEIAKNEGRSRVRESDSEPGVIIFNVSELVDDKEKYGWSTWWPEIQRCRGVQTVKREGRKRNPSPQIQRHEACERGSGCHWRGLQGAVLSGNSGIPGRAGLWRLPLEKRLWTEGDFADDCEFPEDPGKGYRSLVQGHAELHGFRVQKREVTWSPGSCGGNINRDKRHNEMSNDGKT